MVIWREWLQICYKIRSKINVMDHFFMFVNVFLRLFRETKPKGC